MSIDLKEYLNNPDQCPYCDSDDVGAEDGEFMYINGWRNVYCHSCGKHWIEEFTITRIEEDEDASK